MKHSSNSKPWLVGGSKPFQNFAKSTGNCWEVVFPSLAAPQIWGAQAQHHALGRHFSYRRWVLAFWEQRPSTQALWVKLCLHQAIWYDEICYCFSKVVIPMERFTSGTITNLPKQRVVQHVPECANVFFGPQGKWLGWRWLHCHRFVFLSACSYQCFFVLMQSAQWSHMISLFECDSKHHCRHCCKCDMRTKFFLSLVMIESIYWPSPSIEQQTNHYDVLEHLRWMDDLEGTV